MRSDRRGTCDGGSLASDDKSRREAAPSEVLRVLMQVGCSVHIFSVMARVLYSVTTILSRFSCVLTSRECANGTRTPNRADNDQVAQWSPGAQPGHERVIKNMFTLNILKYTPPKGTLTAMWRRYRRRRRVIAPPSDPKRAVSDWHGDSEPDDGPARREATDPRRGRSWALLDSRDRVRGRLCGRGEGRRAHERGAGDRREEHQVVDA